MHAIIPKIPRMSEIPLAPCSFMHQTVADTRVLAHAWIRKFVLEAQNYAIVLCGAVGAGKTTFVKYCLLALGVLHHEADFASPSFNIVSEYRPPPPQTLQKSPVKHRALDTVYHIDLYKIKNIREIEDIGLFESTEGAIRFVEWPERIAWAVPTPYYCVRIHIATEHTRDYLFSFVQERSAYHGT